MNCREAEVTVRENVDDEVMSSDRQPWLLIVEGGGSMALETMVG